MTRAGLCEQVADNVDTLTADLGEHSIRLERRFKALEASVAALVSRLDELVSNDLPYENKEPA